MRWQRSVIECSFARAGRGAVASLALTVTFGCTGGQPVPPPAVRDSAGVRIVTPDTIRGSGSSLSVEPRALLRLGGAQVAEQLEFAASHSWLSAVRLANGNVIANDLAELKLFSPRGKLIRSVGRTGDGPGEFRGTRELCLLRGDSLLVIEYLNGRISLWDSAGNHLQSYPRPGFVPLQGCDADGRIVVRGARFVGQASQEDVRMAAYRLTRADGSDSRELGRFPSTRYAGPFLFEPALVPRDSALLVADPTSGEMRFYDFSGRLTLIVRFDWRREPISDAEWTERVAKVIAVNPDGTRNAQVSARIAAQRPRTRPAFGRVIVDDVPRIWVADAEDRNVWRVFTWNGEYLGRLVTPTGTLVGASRDEVVLLVRDSDGMASLEFHRLSAKSRP